MFTFHPHKLLFFVTVLPPPFLLLQEELIWIALTGLPVLRDLLHIPTRKSFLKAKVDTGFKIEVIMKRVNEICPSISLKSSSSMTGAIMIERNPRMKIRNMIQNKHVNRNCFFALVASGVLLDAI